MLIQAFQSMLIIQATGHYLVRLEAEFGWSKSAMSAAFSVNRAESALLGPAQGFMLDRLGPRRVARVGAVVLAVGFVLFSLTQELWHFFASFLIISIGAGLSGFLTVTVAIVRWFERKRARALVLGSVGFAAGGAMVWFVVWMFGVFGWRATAAGSGIVAGVVIFVLAGWLHGLPTDHGEHVDGIPPEEAAQMPRAEGLTDVHFTAREAVRTRAFWMISLGHMSALFAVGGVMAHLPLYLTGERGYTDFEAGVITSALPLMQLAGMGVSGAIGDRVNKRLIASLAMLGHAAGMMLLAFGVNVVFIAAFVVLHGLAWGARGPLMQALRADYFGTSSFGAIMGISSLIVMLGTTLGPLIAGILADVTGSYRAGFTVLAVLAGLGMTFFVLATPPAPPTRGGDTGDEDRLGLGGEQHSNR